MNKSKNICFEILSFKNFKIINDISKILLKSCRAFNMHLKHSRLK